MHATLRIAAGARKQAEGPRLHMWDTVRKMTLCPRLVQGEQLGDFFGMLRRQVMLLAGVLLRPEQHGPRLHWR